MGDGWTLIKRHKNTNLWVKDDKEITVHKHRNKPYGVKLRRVLIKITGWDLEDLIRLKIVKPHKGSKK